MQEIDLGRETHEAYLLSCTCSREVLQTSVQTGKRPAEVLESVRQKAQICCSHCFLWIFWLGHKWVFIAVKTPAGQLQNSA